MLDSRSSPTTSPFTEAVSASCRKPSVSRYGSSSSAVTRYGPRVAAVSLPLQGPNPTFISADCRSRADQSLKIV